MTTLLPGTAAVPPCAPRISDRRSTTRSAVAWVLSSALVAASWAVSVLMTIDGLVRAHDAALLGFAEIGGATLPATGGIVLARLVHRSPGAGLWAWLGVLPTAAGWYLLARLV